MKEYKKIEKLENDIIEYIDYYNNKRIMLSLSYQQIETYKGEVDETIKVF